MITSHPTILLGTAARTINPPQGLPLVGYPSGRPNTGIALDLFARATVLGSAQTKAPSAALIVLDTIGVSPELVKNIRQAAAQQIKGLDPASIMVSATHTHSAPALFFRRGAEGDHTQTAIYGEQTVKTAAETLAAAWKDAAEVLASIARTEVRLGHNRRVVDAEGRATNNWHDVEGRHTGFFNPNVRILLFKDARTQKPRALFSFYACHPVTLGPGNTKVSADYPGHFARAIEAALPGCLAIHVTSGAANINPRNALADDPEKAKPAGDILAQAVLEELPHARPINPTPILTRTETLSLPIAPDARPGHVERAQNSPDGKTVSSEIQVLRLGEIALISSPGELFGEIALAIENCSPFQTTFVAAYSNDNLGYLCTDTARREGGYEPRNAISHETENQILKTSFAALDSAKAAG